MTFLIPLLTSLSACSSQTTQTNPSSQPCTGSADCQAGFTCSTVGQCVPIASPMDMSGPGPQDLSMDQGSTAQAALSYAWSKRYGSAGNENARSLVVDSKGNTWLAGRFPGPLDFGGTVLSNAQYSWFLAKFSPTGKILSVKSLGNFVFSLNAPSAAPVLAIDSSDNLYFSGMFVAALGNNVDCGNGAVVGVGGLGSGSPLFAIFRFDSTGTCIWSTGIVLGPSAGLINSMAVDSTGELLLTGVMVDQFSFGKTNLLTVGGTDIFLAKLHATDGSEVWAKRFGSSGADIGASVAIAPNDDVILTGSFSLGVDFGGGLLANHGGREVFVARYTKDGQHVWSNSFGSVSNDDGLSVAVSSSGTIVLGGSYSAALSIQTGKPNCVLAYAGGTDAFVATLDETGACSWARGVGDAMNDATQVVSWDPAQNVVAVGTYSGAVDFGLGVQVAMAQDLFAVRLLQTNGATTLARGYGSAGNETANAMHVDGSGAVYICGGTTSDALDFGGGALNTAGTVSEDIYVAKFSGS